MIDQPELGIFHAYAANTALRHVLDPLLLHCAESLPRLISLPHYANSAHRVLVDARVGESDKFEKNVSAEVEGALSDDSSNGASAVILQHVHVACFGGNNKESGARCRTRTAG